jgi:hypothetical protein
MTAKDCFMLFDPIDEDVTRNKPLEHIFTFPIIPIWRNLRSCLVNRI